MTALPQSQDIFYPSEDGEPLAETSVHADAIIEAVVALRQYLASENPANSSAIVLADQFLYYAQGFPRLRVAPDIMVIFDVPPGPRDSYKIWEERQVPIVVFEMTSQSTRSEDMGEKRMLYERLGVLEYWLFDPKGEWIPEQLRGYRLQNETYQPITDTRSQPLQLRLAIDGLLLGFYREDTGEKVLAPAELVTALRLEQARATEAEQRASQAEQRASQAEQRASQAEQRASQAEQTVEQLRARLRSLGADPDADP